MLSTRVHIDTLHAQVWCTLSEAFRAACDARFPVVMFGAEPWEFIGAARYATAIYRGPSGTVVLGYTGTNASAPALRVQFGARLCRSGAWAEALREVVANIGGTVQRAAVGRLDLCADVVPMTAAGVWSFSTRASIAAHLRADGTVEDSTPSAQHRSRYGRATGWSVGRRGPEGLHVRVYDKAKQLGLVEDAGFWREAWSAEPWLGVRRGEPAICEGPAWATDFRLPVTNLWRIEVEAGADHLSRMGAREFADLGAGALQRVWRHATSDFLSCSEPAWWLAHRAEIAGRVEVDPFKAHVPTPARRDQLIAQARGVLLAAAGKLPGAQERAARMAYELALELGGGRRYADKPSSLSRELHARGDYLDALQALGPQVPAGVPGYLLAAINAATGGELSQACEGESIRQNGGGW